MKQQSLLERRQTQKMEVPHCFINLPFASYNECPKVSRFFLSESWRLGKTQILQRQDVDNKPFNDTNFLSNVMMTWDKNVGLNGMKYYSFIGVILKKKKNAYIGKLLLWWHKPWPGKIIGLFLFSSLSTWSITSLEDWDLIPYFTTTFSTPEWILKHPPK